MDLDKIICGWYVDKSKYNIANIVIILAAFSVYKSRIIYSQTNKQTHIESLFICEMKRIDQIMSHSTKRPRIKIDPKMWYDTKVHFNI
jgi:hypothetical protein